MNERAGARGAPHVPPSGGRSPFAFALLVEDEWSATWRTGSKLFSTRCQRELAIKDARGRLAAAVPKATTLCQGEP